ncbi:MAG TPA: hypothetical protein VHA07_15090 [Devosia sp.]|nr:hypothetical protein [Devosia sp.]
MKLTLPIAVLAALVAGPALAVPMCDGPDFTKLDAHGRFLYSEQEVSREAERQLHSLGIDAHDTRFWNGCIQTFVRDARGHDVMRFFDPDTYAEVPVN